MKSGPPSLDDTNTAGKEQSQAPLAASCAIATPPATFGDALKLTAPGQHHSILQTLQSLVKIVVIALFIITFTMQPFRIPSASMEPTLLVGDFLLVNKQVGSESLPRLFPPAGDIHRGDVIVFHYPVDASLHLVKRVIGLPGDHLRLRSGHVFINGNETAEPYTMFQPSLPDTYRDDFPTLASADPGVDSRWWIQMRSLVSQGELTVPPDHYFVLGDNRNNSEDSRYWGLVPRASIVGKPILVYFSLNDDGAVSSQTPAVALTGRNARSPGGTDTVINFARWDRALHVVR